MISIFINIRKQNKKLYFLQLDRLLYKYYAEYSLFIYFVTYLLFSQVTAYADVHVLHIWCINSVESDEMQYSRIQSCNCDLSF